MLDIETVIHFIRGKNGPSENRRRLGVIALGLFAACLLYGDGLITPGDFNSERRGRACHYHPPIRALRDPRHDGSKIVEEGIEDDLHRHIKSCAGPFHHS